MTPLRVWCDLAEPIVYSGDGLPLDGILAAAVMRDLPYAVTSKWPTATRDEPWLLDLDLPLAKWEVPYAEPCHPRLRNARGLVWGWSASYAHADWIAHTSVEVRKRVAIDDMVRWSAAPDVDVAAGRFKAHDLRLAARIARRLEWYAVGDEREIERLLREHITAVGRKVGHGNGRVLRWRVEQWAEDWSVLRHGRLTRAMPAGFVRGMHAVRRGVRPVYWHPSRQIVCNVPEDA